MEYKYEEKTVKELRFLVSDDGEYKAYVGSYAQDSEEFERAKKRVREYEDSVECMLNAEINAIPHVMYDCDSYRAASVLMDACNSSEDSVYVFRITKREQMETIYKWLSLHGNREPSICKELVKVETRRDGTPYDKEYWARYTNSKGMPYSASFDPDYFVGHDVVVIRGCDKDWGYVEGTLEDIEKSRETALKLMKDQLNESMK